MTDPIQDEDLIMLAKEWVLAGYTLRAWFRGATRQGVNSSPSVNFRAWEIRDYGMVCALQDGTWVAQYERGELGWRKQE